MKKSTLLQIIAAILGPIMLVGAVFFATNTNYLTPIAASAYTTTFDKNNSPTLSGGSGTITDRAGIVWEYYNASNYSDGHVTLNHQGYFGVSAASLYGITGVDCITPNFTSNGNELWLLKSVDGINWNEDHILESGNLVISANNWRYLRFYNWSDTNTSIDIKSINISYTCDQSLRNESAAENIDSAKASNVLATSTNLSYSAEYSELSPNSIGGEAVSFEKTDTGNTDLTIGFDKTYTVSDAQNAKVEFDMKTSNINYGKTLVLIQPNGSTLGSTVYSNKGTSYKCTNIQDDWYHIEVPITALISTISGYNDKDKPNTDVEKKEFNAIKINAGACVIDNLRVDTSPCDLGIFNNPTYKPLVGEKFWLKVSWVGKLYPKQVSMSFSDNTLARRVSLDDPLLMNGSPFYIELLGSGTLIITCNVTCGYNRRVQTIQHTVTIN